MALIFSNLKPAASSTGTSAVQTLTSVALTGRRLHLLAVTADRGSNATLGDPSVTQTGATWALVASRGFSQSSRRKVAIFRCQPTANVTAADITITWPQTTTARLATVDISNLAIVNDSANNGAACIVRSGTAGITSGTASTLSVTLGATPAVLNATYGAGGTQIAAAVTFTPGTGFSELTDEDGAANNIAQSTEYWNFSTGNATATVSMTRSGANTWGMVALEIARGLPFDNCTEDAFTAGSLTGHVYTPTGIQSGNGIVYHHHHTDLAIDWRHDDVVRPVIQALIDAGHSIGSIATDTANQWGNNAHHLAYAIVTDEVQSHASGMIGRLASSKGGIGVLYAVDNGEPSTGIYLVDTAWDMFNLYDLDVFGAQGQINTAYNIPAGGTYAAQTAGHDPNTLAADSWAGQYIRCSASPDDTIAVDDVHSLDLIATLTGTKELSLFATTGQHYQPSHFDAADVTSFFTRAFTQDWTGTGVVVNVVAESGAWSAPPPWPGSEATISIAAATSLFQMDATTWTGTEATSHVSAASGTWTGTATTWTGTDATGHVSAASGTWSAPQPQTWTGGTDATVTLTATSGLWIGIWTGSTAVVDIAATSNPFSVGVTTPTYVGDLRYTANRAASRYTVDRIPTRSTVDRTSSHTSTETS